MDRYQKVEKPKQESPINENEIRITTQGAIRNYISYATTLLQEKRVKEIVLKAMGQAISKTVAIAEIIKKRIPQLHQDTAISSESITDVWEPIEEGLVPVEMTRHVSMISITLSTSELKKDSPGYEPPNPLEHLRPQPNYQNHLQPRQGRAPYNAVNEDSYGRGRGRGRGQGRGRGRGRGWSRGGGYGNHQGGYGNYQGGYGNYQGGYGNYQNDNDGYPRRGRGYGNYQDDNGGYPRRGRGYGNYQDDNGGYPSRSRGYGNYQDDNDGYQSRGRGYGNYQDDTGGFSIHGRGGGRVRGRGYRGTSYERGRSGGGKGYAYARGQGRTSGRSSGPGNMG